MKRHPIILIFASILAIVSFPMKWSSYTSPFLENRGEVINFVGYEMFHANMYYLPTIFYIGLALVGLAATINNKEKPLLYKILFLLHLLPMGGFAFVLTVDYYWGGYWDAVYLGWYLYLVASSITFIWLWQRAFVKPPKITNPNLLDDL